MISLSNFDSSFFDISITGTDRLKKDPLFKDMITEDVISMEITEQMGGITQGTLVLRETDSLAYSHFMKLGTSLDIAWGYKKRDMTGREVFRQANNPTALFSPTMAARRLKAIVKNPGGSGDERGALAYRCSFRDASMMSGGKKVRNYNAPGLTKDALVRMKLIEMQIPMMTVGFRRGKEPVYGDTAIRQDNASDFKFLNQYSLEWRCLFRIAYTPQGIPHALFCDYDNEVCIQSWLNSVENSIGISVVFDYKFGEANVKSYDWSYNEGDSGMGDNVRLMMVNGQPQFFYYRAQGQTVIYYKLNIKRIEREILAGGASTVKDLLAKDNFESMVGPKNYFEPVESSTAPQGIGLTINMETVGNPLCTAPARAKFGEGFPDILRIKRGLIFYITKVTHKIDRNGYNMSVSVADSFTVSGGSFVG